MLMQPLDRSTLQAILSRWDARTAGLSPETPSVPLQVLLGDAVDLAAFIETHYEPAVLDHELRPGLASVESHSQINRGTAREIEELQTAIGFVQAQLRLHALEGGGDPLESASRLIGELRSALSFLLDGRPDTEGAKTLRRLREESRSMRAHDGVAMILEGYAELGARHADALESIGVPATLLSDALTEAKRLRARSADRIVQRARDPRRLLRLRNRLIAALQERLRLARRAIRYVFRDHPEIAQQATSAYERARRASGARSLEGEPPTHEERPFEVAS